MKRLINKSGILKALPLLPVLLGLGLVMFVDPGFAQDGASPGRAYNDIPFIGSRNLIWIIAQTHLLFAGFVLGVPMFALACEYIGFRTGDMRYDKLAREFTKLLTASYATTALLGGIFSLLVDRALS